MSAKLHEVIGNGTSRLTVLIVIVVGELANASGALGQLGAGTVGVADAVDFLAIAAVDGVIAVASSIDHGLADRAALSRNVVVVELLCHDGADG